MRQSSGWVANLDCDSPVLPLHPPPRTLAGTSVPLRSMSKFDRRWTQIRRKFDCGLPHPPRRPSPWSSSNPESRAVVVGIFGRLPKPILGISIATPDEFGSDKRSITTVPTLAPGIPPGAFLVARAETNSPWGFRAVAAVPGDAGRTWSAWRGELPAAP